MCFLHPISQKRITLSNCCCCWGRTFGGDNLTWGNLLARRTMNAMRNLNKLPLGMLDWLLAFAVPLICWTTHNCALFQIDHNLIIPLETQIYAIISVLPCLKKAAITRRNNCPTVLSDWRWFVWHLCACFESYVEHCATRDWTCCFEANYVQNGIGPWRFRLLIRPQLVCLGDARAAATRWQAVFYFRLFFAAEWKEDGERAKECVYSQWFLGPFAAFFCQVFCTKWRQTLALFTHSAAWVTFAAFVADCRMMNYWPNILFWLFASLRL